MWTSNSFCISNNLLHKLSTCFAYLNKYAVIFRHSVRNKYVHTSRRWTTLKVFKSKVTNNILGAFNEIAIQIFLTTVHILFVWSIFSVLFHYYNGYYYYYFCIGKYSPLDEQLPWEVLHCFKCADDCMQMLLCICVRLNVWLYLWVRVCVFPSVCLCSSSIYRQKSGCTTASGRGVASK